MNLHHRVLQHITIRSETTKALRTIGTMILAMMLIGIMYAIVFSHAHPHAILNGIGIGFTIGSIGSAAEVFVFLKYRRHMTFTVLLILRTLFYMVLIGTTVFLIIGMHYAKMNSIPFSQALQTSEFQTFLYGGEYIQIVAFALIVSFVANFIRQINRLLGHNALLMFITGKYYQPFEEDRIFMFLDLNSSTAIAEKLGNKLYHSFLNDFFYDISDAIVESKGNVYQYVGDEVVVTWTKEKGLKEANCINCYFRIAVAIQLQAEKYEQRYGFVPEFKAGYHYGPVISGEIGDIKREIVYHGDTVNTAARIRSECTVFKKDLLLSADLLNKLSISDYLSPQSMGKIKLRGKEEEVELFSILEAA